MAALDVSDALTDPDFQTIITVISTVQSIDETGRTVETQSSQEISAVVEAGTGQMVKYPPDGSRISDSIRVFSLVPLYAAQSGHRSADIVVYKGYRYQVKVVSDWTNYGLGYSDAVCEFIGVNPQ